MSIVRRPLLYPTTRYGRCLEQSVILTAHEPTSGAIEMEGVVSGQHPAISPRTNHSIQSTGFLGGLDCCVYWLLVLCWLAG